MTIPTIALPERLQTRRLILRAPRAADAACMFEAYTRDAQVVRYLVWRPHQKLSETEAFVVDCMAAWESASGRPYVLAYREAEAIAIGMLDARILTPSHTIDLGYVLQRASWGHGLMHEAVDALSEAALALPACLRIQASCDMENLASARVLEKAGFVREGCLERHAVLPNLGAEARPSLLYARCRGY